MTTSGRSRSKVARPASPLSSRNSHARAYVHSRFTVRAGREIEAATLVLDPGWLEGITLNTMVPAPVGEANRDGKIALDLGHVRAGTKHVLFLHFQVNPTELGRRSQDVALYDGDELVLEIPRTVTIFP